MWVLLGRDWPRIVGAGPGVGGAVLSPESADVVGYVWKLSVEGSAYQGVEGGVGPNERSVHVKTVTLDEPRRPAPPDNLEKELAVSLRAIPGSGLG